METCTQKDYVKEFYSEEEIQDLRAITNNTRRISSELEFEIKPNNLCQAIDVDIYLEGNTTLPMKNMPDYPFRSVKNTIEYLKEVTESGISSVLLHLVGNEAYISPYDVLNKQMLAIQEIRTAFPKGTLDITIDPFMTAFNPDGTWGIKNKEDTLLYYETLNLLANIAIGYSEVGVDGIITLGRIECEVEVTKKALDKINSDLKIKSFSQNSETANAYMYLDDLPRRLETGQKVLVGNITEMHLRTILDIHDGASVIVIKPIENLHLITKTILFLQRKDIVLEFLNSEKVNKLTMTSEILKKKVSKIKLDIDKFHEKCTKVKIGAYSVSGTYYIYKSLEERKDARFTFGLLDELLKNGISAAGDHLDNIMERNSLWYLNKKDNMNNKNIG